ncbi:MAG: TonB-dependent receptor [Alphaproteobacteria bacterium]
MRKSRIRAVERLAFRRTRLAGAGFAALMLAAVLAGPGIAKSNDQDEDGAVIVTGSRIESGAAGTSTTIITAADIEAAPASTVPGVLSYYAGIQVRDLYGGVGSARSTVDIRGFGATAVSNTLVLINGRRLNDIDVAAIDWSNIPLDAISRIEVIRGNSGAVLYGDGAVGGVINIITHSPLTVEPMVDMSVGLGTLNHDEAAVSTVQHYGDTAVSFFTNTQSSDGYRDNNDFDQRNGVFEVRHDFGDGELYASVSADDQTLRLPGVRRVTLTSNLLASDRTGATTPFDYALQNGLSGTLGGTWAVAPGADLIVDGGVRRKDQDAVFISAFGAAFDSHVDTDLTTWSLTPRVNLAGDFGTLPSSSTVGVDLYYADYNSDRKNHLGDPPIKRYDARQRSVALYGQTTITVSGDTTAHAGGRVQQINTVADDVLDTTAPGYSAFSHTNLALLDKSETELAASVGVEHQLTAGLGVFARAARSFRSPTIDERIGTGGATFNLETQTSYDVEAGVRSGIAGGMLVTSAYVMDLEDEIAFDPVNFINRNLDPTRRYGVEAQYTVPVAHDLSLSLNGAYTRAVFRSGANEGNDVPLVARWTGSSALTWQHAEWLSATVVASYVGEKRLDNDAANFQPMIPAYSVVDLRLGGEYGGFYWEGIVNNLFEEEYVTYGVASASTFGTYNAYPMPERTVLARFGVRF